MGSITPEKPLRLAILENDTPQPQTKAQYASYGGVFQSLLGRAAATLEPPQRLEQQLDVSCHDVVNDLDSYPDLDDVDALLLTGSRHNVFDNDPWILRLVEYTQQALARGKKIVGVCYGHQIIGRAVGAPVGKSDRGWEVSVTEVELTKEGKDIFGLDKLRIHQMHRDIVCEFPSDAIPLGSNDICKTQAMYKPGQYIAVQGHPEFTQDIQSEILVNRNAAGIIPDDVFKDGMQRAALEHDGVAIARGFIKFLRQG